MISVEDQFKIHNVGNCLQIPEPLPLLSNTSDKPSTNALAKLAEVVRRANGGKMYEHNQRAMEQIADLINRARLVLCEALLSEVGRPLVYFCVYLREPVSYSLFPLSYVWRLQLD